LTLLSASTIADGYFSDVIGMSHDGRYVYFVSDDQLVSGQPAIDTRGVYLWHDGVLSFIGQFATPDADHDPARNGTRNVAAPGSGQRAARVAADGSLLFISSADQGFRGRGGFTGHDHASFRELYLYRPATGRLACVSCATDNHPSTAPAGIDVSVGVASATSTGDSANPLTDDGRRVFFSTADALLPEDGNGTSDVYEFDAADGTLHLISSGRDGAPSYLLYASSNGDDVFFVTRERLVGWDSDNSYDAYDARIGGGFPEPSQPLPLCSADGCLPRQSSAPDPSATATDHATASGDAVSDRSATKRKAKKPVAKRKTPPAAKRKASPRRTTAKRCVRDTARHKPRGGRTSCAKRKTPTTRSSLTRRTPRPERSSK
jgi:hypothetical protein